MTDIDRLQKIIDDSRRIVFFGGAGVSTESGIPDFRSQDGLYHMNYDYPPEEIVSHSFFMQKPEEFWRFYREKMMVGDARPNPAHLKLAELEKSGRLDAVVTQNIDGLHQQAGSRKVFELHGSTLRYYCMTCRKPRDAAFIRKSPEVVPVCPDCGGKIRPDVVLYEEGLDENVLCGAIRAIAQADCLIIGGTSLAVYPAASLIDYFSGKYLVVINKTPTPRDSEADLLITRPIGETFSAIQVNPLDN